MKNHNIILLVIALIAIVYGMYGVIGFILFSSISEEFIELAIVVAGVYVFILIFGLVMGFIAWKNEKKHKQHTAVIGVTKAHDKITVDRVSELTDIPVSKVSKILYEAAASGKIKGTVKGDTFVRTEETTPGLVEKVTVEREVMVSRKVPENCFKCGAAINPQEVEWVGPDSVRCPHCGATLGVSTERV